jgi:hypothetical protein
VGLVARDSGGVAATVAIFNATGHRLPTAEPHRSLELRVELLDADGIVAQGSSVLARRADTETLSEAPGRDSTLAPREQRTVVIEAPRPARPFTRARLVVDFWLWEPDDAVAQAAGLDAPALARRVYEAEVPLP